MEVLQVSRHNEPRACRADGISNWPGETDLAGHQYSEVAQLVCVGHLCDTGVEGGEGGVVKPDELR